MTESEALGVMMTAHRKGRLRGGHLSPREVAETKAHCKPMTWAAQAGVPLTFTTEREE